MNQVKIGNFIALKRKEKNLTQEQLAEKLGVSNKTISKWECGRCMPDYSLVEFLCEELDISVSELISGQEGNTQKIDSEQVLERLKELEEMKIRDWETNGKILILLSLILYNTSVLPSPPLSPIILNILLAVSGFAGVFALVLGILWRRKNNKIVSRKNSEK